MSADIRNDRSPVPARGSTKRRSLADALVVLAAAVTSQAFFYLAGGQLSLRWISASHFLDFSLYRDQLLESVWYMHMQPPLFNLLTGLCVKIFPRSYETVFALLFFLLSLVLAWTIYRLMRFLNVGRGLALALTVCYQFGRPDLFYRNFYFYTYPLMTLLVLAGYFLSRYLKDNGLPAGTAFFCSLAALTLTRALYHPVWIGVITIGLLILSRGRRRQILLMAAIPLMLVVIWMGKNYYLFGSFTMNSQLGYSLAKIATRFLTPGEKERLLREGRVSPLVEIYPHNRYPVYYDYISEVETYWHPVEVLTQRHKTVYPPSDPRPPENFNHLDHLVLSRQYARDAFRVIRHCPRAYLRGVSRAALVYFLPTWMAFDIWAMRMPELYDRFWAMTGGSFAALAEPDPDLYRDIAYTLPRVCWFVVLAYALVAVIIIHDLIRKTGIARWSRDRLITLGFLVFTVGYVTVMGIMLDYGENNRFRAEIVPLTVIIGAACLQRLFRGRRFGWSGRSGGE